MTDRAVLAAVLVASASGGACGPTTRGPAPPPAASVREAAVVAVAPDAATLDHLIEVLRPVGGDRLAALRFAVDGRIEAWPTGELAAHGIRPDAPIGVAMTADGVVIRFARVGDAKALAAAFDGAPCDGAAGASGPMTGRSGVCAGATGGARWKTDGADLWRFGDDAIAVIAGDRVAAVSGGAGSKREQAALELASGELDPGAAPRAGGIAFEIDGELVVAAAIDAPGPVMKRLGADLGRVRAELSGETAVIGVDIEVTPAGGSIAAELIAGGSGAKVLIPDAPVAFGARITPAHVGDIVTELGAIRSIDVPAFLQAIGRDATKVYNGAIALAPGAATVRFSDPDTMVLVSKLVDPLVFDRDYEHGALAFGGRASDGGGGIGVVIAPGQLAEPHPIAPGKPELPKIDDDNTDVPWSMDYRDARTAFEAAKDKYDAAVQAKKFAVDQAWYRWSHDFGLVSVEMTPVAGRAGTFHGHGEWHPAKGTIAATAAEAAAEYDVMSGLESDIDAAYAGALAAHDKALKIRAKDVQAWDNKKH